MSTADDGESIQFGKLGALRLPMATWNQGAKAMSDANTSDYTSKIPAPTSTHSDMKVPGLALPGWWVVGVTPS